MIEIIKQNKIILIVLVLVVVGFTWFGFFREPVSTTLLTNESRADASVAEQEILRLLLDMRSIRLDSSIFENSAFASLRDFGREIIPEPVGRTNPFAPTQNFNERTNTEDSQNNLFDEEQ